MDVTNPSSGLFFRPEDPHFLAYAHVKNEPWLQRQAERLGNLTFLQQVPRQRKPLNRNIHEERNTAVRLPRAYELVNTRIAVSGGTIIARMLDVNPYI